MSGGYLDAAIAGTIVSLNELKRSAKGTAYLRMIVAVGDGDGRQFVTVAVFGELAEEIAAKAEKGGRINAEGALTSSIYERQGKPSVSLNLAARHAHIPGIGKNRPKHQKRAETTGNERKPIYHQRDDRSSDMNYDFGDRMPY